MDEELRELARRAKDSALDRERYFAAVTRAGAWPKLHEELDRALDEDALARGGKRSISGLVMLPRPSGYAPSFWRAIVKPVIAFVVEHTKGWPEKQIKKAITNAYPFGKRSGHPYHIWLDEVARQQGRKRPVNRRGSRPAAQPDEPTRSMFA